MAILSNYFITLKYTETKGKRTVQCCIRKDTPYSSQQHKATDVKSNELRNLNLVAVCISQLGQTFLMGCAQQWGLFAELFAKQFFQLPSPRLTTQFIASSGNSMLRHGNIGAYAWLTAFKLWWWWHMWNLIKLFFNPILYFRNTHANNFRSKS